jgi:hypothetical protein
MRDQAPCAAASAAWWKKDICFEPRIAPHRTYCTAREGQKETKDSTHRHIDSKDLSGQTSYLLFTY